MHSLLKIMREMTGLYDTHNWEHFRKAFNAKTYLHDMVFSVFKHKDTALNFYHYLFYYESIDLSSHHTIQKSVGQQVGKCRTNNMIRFFSHVISQVSTLHIMLHRFINYRIKLLHLFPVTRSIPVYSAVREGPRREDERTSPSAGCSHTDLAWYDHTLSSHLLHSTLPWLWCVWCCVESLMQSIMGRFLALQPSIIFAYSVSWLSVIFFRMKL